MEDEKTTCLQLFWTFFKLGLFTIGGGMAMIPLMQGIIVDKHHWMSEEEVVDCIAVSQALPGVIAINMATYIGRYKKGVPGAVWATVGVILPSFMIIILIVELLQQIGDNRYVQGALTGIKAAATGMIAYSAWSVGRKVLRSWFAWILGIAAFAAVAYFGVNAVWTIVIAVPAGLIYQMVKDRSAALENDTEKGGEDR